MFQPRIYLSKSRLCNGFSGERQKGGRDGGRDRQERVTPHFVIAKEVLKKITISGQR